MVELMQEWEYDLSFAKFEEEYKIIDILTAKGNEGWELVTVMETEGGFNLYFKRPKN